MFLSIPCITPQRIRHSLLIAFLFLLVSCKDHPVEMSQEQTTVGIQLVSAERIAVERSMPGRAVAYMTSSVRPQVDGIIQERLFTEGQEVKAGQLLYQIDPKVYQANYDSAKAELAQAEAAVSSSKPKAQRYLALAKIDAISQQDVDDAVAELRLNEAAVASAKAALQAAKINLDYTRITAPINGHIGTSVYTPGALVIANQEAALTTINQLNPIHVDVTQTNTQMLSLRKLINNGSLHAVDGKVEVSIKLEDGSIYAHKGTLEFVGTSVDIGTGSITMRAVVPNPDHLLLPGSYVIAVLPMAINEKAILVPQNAVSRNTKGEATVKLVDDNNKVIERVVQTGEAINNSWVISDGLAVGEKLIVYGGSKVIIGQEVKTELSESNKN